MKSEAVRLAEIEQNNLIIRESVGILKNPVFALVGAFVVIEALQQVHPGGSQHALMGQNVGTMLETGLVATPVVVALANAEVLGDVLKGVVSSKTGGVPGLIGGLSA